MTTAPLLSVTDLTVTYAPPRRSGSLGTGAALAHVDLDVLPGEILGVVGETGSGKTTLARATVGLVRPAGGRIDFEGADLGALKGRELRTFLRSGQVQLAFQDPLRALDPDLTVGELVGEPLAVAGVPRAERIQRVSESLGLVGLDADSFRDRYPRQLSGGQRQRVAMGRAIVRDPQVFLFDEPLSNLDAKLRVAMRTEIKELHQRLRTTTVYVTHDQIEAMTMADKIVVMHDGIVEQMGAPLDLYDRPENVFVAGFIGSPAMNFIQGRIEADGFVGNGGLRLPLASAPPAAVGKAAVYGIRPEHFRLTSDGIPVEIVVVEPTGSETQVVVKSGGQEMICIFRERVMAKPGETIRVAPDPALVHLFDQGTGRRLT